jgi:hypothetical protein
VSLYKTRAKFVSGMCPTLVPILGHVSRIFEGPTDFKRQSSPHLVMFSHVGWSCEVFWSAAKGYFVDLKGFQVLGKWIFNQTSSFFLQ